MARWHPYSLAQFKRQVPCGSLVYVKVVDTSQKGQVEALDRLDKLALLHIGQCGACKAKVIVCKSCGAIASLDTFSPMVEPQEVGWDILGIEDGKCPNCRERKDVVQDETESLY